MRPAVGSTFRLASKLSIAAFDTSTFARAPGSRGGPIPDRVVDRLACHVDHVVPAAPATAGRKWSIELLGKGLLDETSLMRSRVSNVRFLPVTQLERLGGFVALPALVWLERAGDGDRAVCSNARLCVGEAAELGVALRRFRLGDGMRRRLRICCGVDVV